MMRPPTLASYLSSAEVVALCKLAEPAGGTHAHEEKPKSPPETKGRIWPVVRPVLAGAAGMGVGTLAGAGAAALSDKIYKRVTGQSIPTQYLLTAAPYVGAAMGMAYNLAQARQIEEMRRALDERKHEKPEHTAPHEPKKT